MRLFIVVFLAIIATIDFSRPQTPDFPKKKVAQTHIISMN